MPLRSHVYSARVCVAGAALALSGLAARSLQAQTGRLEGKVTSAVAETPIADAEVYLPALDRSATTDAEGAFAFAGVPAGTFEILVRAVGFRSQVLADREVSVGAVTTVDVRLEPWGERADAPEGGASDAAFHTRRIGVGLALAYDGLGRAEGAVGSSAALGGFGDIGVSSAVSLRAGIFLSRRGVEPVDYPYELFGGYVEPRYVVGGGGSTWAPFVGAQIGIVREHVSHASMSLSATGTTVAAGGGVQVRVWPQFGTELGVLLGIARFGSYTFRGERAWYECLNTLAPGTGLPESVQDCASSRDIGAVLCYPPFYPADYRISGDCRPPDIPYDGTGRSGTWLRLWLGVHFSLVRGE